MIRLKRVYDPPAGADGLRVLVDRLWPRGLSKDRARVDLWLKSIAPSDSLRKWYGHDPKKWVEFRKRYRRTLADRNDDIQALREKADSGTMTLIYAASDQDRNNAVVVKESVESKGLRASGARAKKPQPRARRSHLRLNRKRRG